MISNIRCLLSSLSGVIVASYRSRTLSATIISGGGSDQGFGCTSGQWGVSSCVPIHGNVRGATVTDANEQIRVLYIEDHQEQRETLAKAMLERGFAVTTVSDGASGIDAFDPGYYDIVLCDLNMPGIDGLQVLKAIRGCCPHTPFVLLTAHGTI
ncbi:response regulator, partial [candidate division GN15 bacterium]|nr:response regulator [candidate division GN15 bacterium]